jgi:hypothetical protein
MVYIVETMLTAANENSIKVQLTPENDIILSLDEVHCQLTMREADVVAKWLQNCAKTARNNNGGI